MASPLGENFVCVRRFHSTMTRGTGPCTANVNKAQLAIQHASFFHDLSFRVETDRPAVDLHEFARIERRSNYRAVHTTALHPVSRAPERCAVGRYFSSLVSGQYRVGLLESILHLGRVSRTAEVVQQSRDLA